MKLLLGRCVNLAEGEFICLLNETERMRGLCSRRTLLSLSIGGLTSLAGCSLVGSDEESLTSLFGGHGVVYQHEQVRLSLSTDTVPLGGTFEYTVTNTSNSTISLGCGSPETLQKFRDDEWRDVIFTSAEGFGGCGSSLAAGASHTEEVTLTESALESRTEVVKEDLEPGRYRLVLLFTEPYLAVEFRIQASQ